MGAVVGIDLGTTNTVVSVVREGQPSTVEDSAGSRLIPSVVSFHPSGQVLVGRAARERRLVDGVNTVFSIKRLIGRSWGSPEVELARQRLPFEMCEGPGLSTMVKARGQDYSLPEISAFVLQKAKSVAEAALGTEVDKAVITVPASFNDLQRAATKMAGRVAGLDVLRILNEPTAAALAHGFSRGHPQRLAIYDFGGGTFDLTLIDLSDNVFEVLSTAGDSFLGGDDIDNAVAELMAADFLARYRHDARTSVETFDRLRVAAEQLKIRLGSAESATIEIDELAVGVGGKSVNAVFSLTRAELERAARPIVDRTFGVCDEAMRIAKLTFTDFDHILLVGGATRMPLVRRRVAEYFGREPRHHANPDEVVALGAAIQATALTLAQRRQLSIPTPPESPAVRHRLPQQTLLGTGLPPAPSRPPRRPAEPPDSERLPHVLTGRVPSGPPVASSTRPSAGVQRPPPAPSSRRQAGAAPESRTPPQRTSPSAHAAPLPEELPLVGVGITAAAALAEASRRAGQRSAPPHRAVPTAPMSAAPPAESSPLAPRQIKPRASPPVYELDESHLGDSELSGLFAEPPQDGAHAAPNRFSASSAAVPSGTVAMPEVPGEEYALPLPGLPRAGGTVGQASRPPLGSAAERQSGAPLAHELAQRAPLLIDVTPMSLSVETVGGYSDVLVERNTKIPCEQRRVFVTTVDHQTSVTVRVCQGESRRFEENTLLGSVVLDGLRDGRRGEVAVEIGFALDTDGILGVRAQDVATQREASAKLKLVGAADAEGVEALARRHAAQQIR